MHISDSKGFVSRIAVLKQENSLSEYLTCRNESKAFTVTIYREKNTSNHRKLASESQAFGPTWS